MATPLGTPPGSNEEIAQQQDKKSTFDALKTAMGDKASLLKIFLSMRLDSFLTMMMRLSPGLRLFPGRLK